MSDVRKRNNIIVLLSLVIYSLIYFIFIHNSLSSSSMVITGIFTIVLAFVSYFIYGFQHCGLNGIRKKIVLEVAIGLICYFLLINILGIFTGFIKNSYVTDIPSIINYIIAPILSVVALEIFRYIFISANKDSKEIISYGTMAIILFDAAINLYSVENTSVAIFVFISVVIIPVIFKNIFLSYLSYQVGYQSCVLYVLTLAIYNLLTPSIPNIGHYLTSVITILLPSLLYIVSSKMITNNLDGKINKKEIVKTLLIGIPLSLIFIFIAGLTSFRFKYSIVGVNTNSLNPKIDKGDLIFVKTIDYDKYNEGDIIVYKLDEKVIVDTISKIEDGKINVVDGINENDEPIYRTVTKEMVLGKYNNKKIAKLGYPTIWFNGFIQGNANEY